MYKKNLPLYNEAMSANRVSASMNASMSESIIPMVAVQKQVLESYDNIGDMQHPENIEEAINQQKMQFKVLDVAAGKDMISGRQSKIVVNGSKAAKTSQG